MDGYLLVKVLNQWTQANAKRMIDDAKKEAVSGGYQRLLMDLSNWSRPDTEFTRFSSGEYLAKMLPPPFKVAAFAHPKSITKFGENTAFNRGAWFQIFPDDQTAIQWLMK
jgi:hypothetical protein